MLELEVFHLLLADAMLAGAGALHGERPLDQAVDEGLAGRDFRRIVHVHERLDMEIAVAHMADDRGDEPGRLDIPFRFVDAFRKARDRHADIGRNRFAPGRRPRAAQ